VLISGERGSQSHLLNAVAKVAAQSQRHGRQTRETRMKQALQSIKGECLALVQAPASVRFYFYGKFFFVFTSLLWGSLYLLFGGYWIIAGLLTTPGLTDLMGKPLGSDFVAFYAASKLALEGDPSGIYAIAKLHPLEKAVIGAEVGLRPWHYPPSFLIMVFPLALFPYGAAFALWILPTWYGSVRLVRRLAPHFLTPWLFLAFLPAICNLFYGQNGFLSTLVMGGGLLLVDGRPFLGGLFLGLLSYKPQLAMVIPVALVAGGNWRALGGAAVSAIGLALISLLVFGIAPWQAFVHNLSYATEILKYNAEYWRRMPTVFAAVRLLGAGLPLTEALQLAMTLVAIAAVAWIWWKRLPLPFRASGLALAIFLAAPFAFEYDLALLALPFAWLGWEEVSNGRRKGQGILAACWLSMYFPLWFPGKNLYLPALLLMLGLVIYRGATGDIESGKT
jgi:alpha-1,2-mannosyltransferase